mgnify:FL=1|jgi:hypothetical protein
MQMLMTSPNYIPATRRMHVGKELEQFESLRFYDPLPVRFTTPDPLALSYPFLSPLRLLRKQPGMQRGLGWKENTFCKRSVLRIQTAIPYSDKNSKRT